MPDSVTQWLKQLGLEEYAEAFDKNAVDWKTLPELDHELLKEIGVNAVGHRVAILKAIESFDIGPELADDASSVALPLSPAAEAERRQLTVMFCDLVGSTELSQKLDPEDLREVNRAYQDACKAAIERYEGYVARYMGDGVLAYFGYPQAHEDDAERAIHAGLGVVEAMAGLNTTIGNKQGIELGVRVGIATGAVVVGDLIGEGASQESAVVGETPNLAARLQTLASRNAVVVGPGTHELATGRFEYHDLGTQELKGIARPVHAWRVIALAAAESRFEAAHRKGLTPLVGREHEIGLLIERWEQAKEGDGQVVLLSGEAGIGKSRITETLRERTVTDDPVRLRYQCSPYHTNSALHPVIEQLERAARFDAEDSNESRLEKLEALLAQGAVDTERVAPLFAPLLSIPSAGRYAPLGMTPERQKEQTLEAVVAQLEGLSRSQPVLFIFEDAHWADPTSLELLELTIERVQSVPILAVLTYRPEFSSPWGDYTHVTSLTLNRFTRSLATTMVENVTGGKPLPDAVLEQIIEKTDGVPLFVEELTKSILESREEPGRDSDMASHTIPATLQDSLMARLDRLGYGKTVAQMAAVLGREFGESLLSAISDVPAAELAAGLDELVRAGLVFRRGAKGREWYTFKHALIRDAAYESLLRRERASIHGRIAEVWQSVAPDVCEQQPELIAQHYAQAANGPKAIEFWHRAGLKATERLAYQEAINHLEAALKLVREQPPTKERARLELDLLMALSSPLQTTQGYGNTEVEKLLLRASELCSELGDRERRFRVLSGLRGIYLMRGRLRESLERSDELFELATGHGDKTQILGAHVGLCIVYLFTGIFRRSLEHGDAANAIYQIEEQRENTFRSGQDTGVSAHVMSALALWYLGYPDTARRRMHEGVSLAEALEHHYSRAFALFGVVQLHQMRREVDLAYSASRELVELATARSFPYVREFGLAVRGWARVRQGDAVLGIEDITTALAAMREAGTAAQRGWVMTVLADVLVSEGRFSEAAVILGQGRAYVEETGERTAEAELFRIAGDIRRELKSPVLELEHYPDSAAGCYEQGLIVARELDARSLELRAAVGLARLRLEEGHGSSAAAVLDPVYSRFEEGFETADLKEAKALLVEVS